MRHLIEFDILITKVITQVRYPSKTLDQSFIEHLLGMFKASNDSQLSCINWTFFLIRKFALNKQSYNEICYITSTDFGIKGRGIEKFGRYKIFTVKAYAKVTYKENYVNI